MNYEWRGAFTDNEVSALHAEVFEHEPVVGDWNDRLSRLSLGWVIARDNDGLVGFVNIIWDDGQHAFARTFAGPGQRRIHAKEHSGD